MTRKQRTLVLVWAFLLVVLALSLFVSPGTWIVIVVVAGLVVSFFQKDTVPANSTARTPLQILEQSSFWKGAAAVYTVGLVGLVIYHLAVNRIALFEDPPFALFILLLLAPALGPIVLAQVEIYRLLGREKF